MNNYNEQFSDSLSLSSKEWWQKFFKNHQIDWNVNKNQEYDGIDCFINGKKIQLKLREKFYSDILIEFAHTNGEKGWINKEQTCDYIFYGWKDKDEIYVFKWVDLVNFWKEKQVELYGKYKQNNMKYAVNKNKITINFSIPFMDLPKHIIIKL